MVVTTGAKIWSYLKPNAMQLKSVEASKAYIELMDSTGFSSYHSAPDTLPEQATLHNLFLTPGTLL